VWVMNADGSGRHEVREPLDNRQGPPRWSADGQSIYFSVQERGDSHLFRIAAVGGAAERVLPGNGSVGSWSIAKQNAATSIAYAFSTSADPSQLYLSAGAAAPARLTELNH